VYEQTFIDLLVRRDEAGLAELRESDAQTPAQRRMLDALTAICEAQRGRALHADVYQQFSRALADPPDEAVLRVTGLAWAISAALRTGQLDQAQAWADDLRQRLETVDNPSIRAYCRLFGLAALQHQLAGAAAAVRAIDEAFEERIEPGGAIWVQLKLGRAHRLMVAGENDQAEAGLDDCQPHLDALPTLSDDAQYLRVIYCVAYRGATARPWP